jgi:hypothetical protein
MRIALAAALALAAVTGLAGRPGDAAARTGCTEAGTRAALAAFVSAHNRGDSERLDTLFAAEPEFEWYSNSAPGARLGQGAKRRRTLLAYFRRRHAAGDRFALRSFDFNGNSPGHGGGYGNLEMKMLRRVPGYRGGRWFDAWGKGAAICDGESVRLIVVSLGTLIRPRARS